jgi:hypothetical protein
MTLLDAIDAVKVVFGKGETGGEVVVYGWDIE